MFNVTREWKHYTTLIGAGDSRSAGALKVQMTLNPNSGGDTGPMSSTDIQRVPKW